MARVSPPREDSFDVRVTFRALDASFSIVDREGAEEEFDALYRAEWGRLAGALALACGDRGAAEEVAQETFVRAWSRWHRLSGLDHPAGWVYTTGFRLLRRRARRLESAPTAELDGSEVLFSGPETIAVDRVAVTRAIAQLPERQRRGRIVCPPRGVSGGGGATAVNISPAALRQLVHRAVVALRVSSELENRS